MGSTYDFKKLKRVIAIYAGVQVFLLALLVYMAVHFQAVFRAAGKPQMFLQSVVTALVIQLVLFYPVNRFAGREAERDVETCRTGLSAEELAGLRKKRIFSDLAKASVFIFFVFFIARAPAVPFVSAATYFVFILTILSYFQCYNFATRREMRKR